MLSVPDIQSCSEYLALYQVLIAETSSLVRCSYIHLSFLLSPLELHFTVPTLFRLDSTFYVEL